MPDYSITERPGERDVVEKNHEGPADDDAFASEQPDRRGGDGGDVVDADDIAGSAPDRLMAPKTIKIIVAAMMMPLTVAAAIWIDEI